MVTIIQDIERKCRTNISLDLSEILAIATNDNKDNKIWWCIFRPTQIRYTSLVTYDKSDLQARGFTAAKWTCGRSARPPSLS